MCLCLHINIVCMHKRTYWREIRNRLFSVHCGRKMKSGATQNNRQRVKTQVDRNMKTKWLEGNHTHIVSEVFMSAIDVCHSAMTDRLFCKCLSKLTLTNKRVSVFQDLGGNMRIWLARENTSILPSHIDFSSWVILVVFGIMPHIISLKQRLLSTQLVVLMYPLM